MISVLIITKNEEKDLPDCINSVSWSDDIHIFDSFSEDKTIDIAHSLGAKVTQRIFDGFASQRNAALQQLQFKHQWILILDADERVSSELIHEIHFELRQAPTNQSAYRIRRKDFLFGQWLKYSQITPMYIRLVKKGKVYYHRQINEVIEVEGLISDLQNSFDHFPFSKGISHWIEKHNLYSSLEAQRWIDEQSGKFQFSILKAFFSSDFNERRYHQKGLFYKLPARPILKWMYMVVLRRAFLDGLAGLTYSSLQAIYEYFITLKTKEILIRNLK